MTDPQYGPPGEPPSFDKPTGGQAAPGGQPSYPPQQPGYGQAPPPTGYGQAPPPAYGQAPPPGYGAPAFPQQGYSRELSPSDQRMWATLAHAGGILLGFIAGLVVYLVQKDKGIYVTEQAKEALNFQITITIAYVATFFLGLILSFVTFGLAGLLWFVPGILQLVFGIIAAIAANKGENYRYPLTLRLIH